MLADKSKKKYSKPQVYGLVAAKGIEGGACSSGNGPSGVTCSSGTSAMDTCSSGSSVMRPQPPYCHYGDHAGNPCQVGFDPMVGPELCDGGNVVAVGWL